MQHPTATILIPCFNDWESLDLLIPQLDRYLSAASRAARILVVDDASSEPSPDNWPSAGPFTAIHRIEVLRLRSNQGHQRAIALGLYHLHESREDPVTFPIVVMDGDGEDRPQDVPELLARFEHALTTSPRGEIVVFAQRTKRMESSVFRCFYQIYKGLHRLLTGVEVKVGNFSVASRPAVATLMGVPELWNHYAASIFRARIPKLFVPLPRGHRLAGTSQMNFVALLMHGLSAMSVFSEQVSARLLICAASFATLTTGLIGAIAAVRLFTDWAIPGWASTTIGVLLGLVVQALTFTVLFVFLIAHRRNAPGFMPLRDAPYFLLSCATVYEVSNEGVGTSLEPLMEALGRSLQPEPSTTDAPMTKTRG